MLNTILLFLAFRLLFGNRGQSAERLTHPPIWLLAIFATC
jgi:hypothetical protein